MNFYDIIDLSLATERGEDNPKVIRIKRDFLRVLSLTGETNISISDGQTQEYFPLQEKMRVYLPRGKEKTIRIINSAQPGKTLKLFLSDRDNFKIIGG